jgi:hypothetical protein
MENAADKLLRQFALEAAYEFDDHDVPRQLALDPSHRTVAARAEQTG